jgi:hypothetical protein
VRDSESRGRDTRGRIQVGIGEAHCRKQKPSVSIFHLSLIHFGAVSAPGVMAAGAAAYVRRARRWGGSKLSRSLEWSRINKQKIQLLKHGKLSPKSEGIVNVIVSPMKRCS